MEIKTTTQFDVLDTEMLASIQGGTDLGAVGKGAAYGAGIGVAVCTVGGVITGGAVWTMTAGCAWAGAKLGGAFTAIADNIWPQKVVEIMFNYKIVNNQELSNISRGGLGGDVLLGALSGAFQAGQSCIAGGPQA